MMNYRLNYSPNNELQESPVILAGSKPTPPSTKKVWRLKKYHRSEDEIKTQQENYENLEFNTKKTSTRRPKNKNGQQEFVFIDLSPTKKSAKKDEQQNQQSTGTKKQGRVSRLFRLSSSNEELKESSAPPTLMTTKPTPTPPQLSRSQSQLLPNNIPSLPPNQQPVQAPIQPPALKRSYTTANARYNNNEKSSSSASLVMTVSENGRAILQPTASRTLSTSSSVSDLFSLTRMNSSRHSPIPSPRRMESPIHNQHLEDFYEYGPQHQHHHHHHNHNDDDYEDDDHETDSADDSDATKAFSKIIRKQSFRKRANTASSTNSIISSSPAVPRLLQHNQSISSMNSLYKSRISPSRSTLMLRQSTLLQQQQHHQQPLYSPQEQNEFSSTSFFDDVHKNPSRQSTLHKKTTSISDFTAQLGPPLEINSSDNDPESPYTANTDVMLPFEFSTGDMDHHTNTLNHDENFDDTLKNGDDDQQIFDFNAFINYEESHNY